MTSIIKPRLPVCKLLVGNNLRSIHYPTQCFKLLLFIGRDVDKTVTGLECTGWTGCEIVIATGFRYFPGDQIIGYYPAHCRDG